MAPNSSRQVLMWSLPTLAFLLSVIWYRRKRRASLRSDPGGTTKAIASTSEGSVSSESTDIVSCEGHDIVKTIESHIQNLEIKVANCESIISAVRVNVEQSQDIVSVQDNIDIPDLLRALESQISELQDDTESITVPNISVKLETDKREVEKVCIVEIRDELESEVTDKKIKVEEYSEKPEKISETDQSKEDIQGNVTSEELCSDKPERIVQSVSDSENTETSVVEESSEFSSQSRFSTSFSEESSENCEISLQSQASEEEQQTIKDTSEVEDINANSESEVAEDKEVTEVNTMARISSAEASTMEKHEDESIKKLTPVMTLKASDPVSLECKLSSLELDGNASGEVSSDVESVSTNGAVAGSYATPSEHHGAERDSANHSPADVMLASPSISSYSDVQSEGSSDSGKGCSDVATPPSRTPASGSSLSGDVSLPSVYEFVLPQHLVGRLIGRHGCFVHHIKAKTNANILIKRHPDTQKLKICAVEGTQTDIENALDLIRQKFPLKRFSQLTLEQVCFLPPVTTFPLVPDFLQLQLVEGVNNDVILSSLVNTAHFFLQQPTHPTFPALNRLNACMNVCYSEPAAPLLPAPIQAGVICVAPTMGGWYRAQVVSADTESETCDIKFVDYGGYLTVENTMLRQIRSDFMTLPFQAAECYLANVAPIGGEEWSKESYDGMEELTHGQVLQAQIYMYSEDGLPIVYLYAIHDSQVVLVNHELVSRGLAEWVEPTPEA